MTVVLTAIHILVCVVMILVILLQAGKGADMGAIFGGGSSQTLFGASGGQTFMSKATTGLAAGFMLTCLILAYLSSHTASIMPEETQVEETLPAGGASGEDVDDTEAAPAAATGTDSAPAEPAPAQPADEAEAPAEPADPPENPGTGAY